MPSGVHIFYKESVISSSELSSHEKTLKEACCPDSLLKE